MEDNERFIDDLIFPKKKTLIDLCGEEFEREFNGNNTSGESL